MRGEDLVYKVAMSFLKGLGPIRINNILSELNPAQFFTLSISDVKQCTRISSNQLASMERNRALDLAVKEIEACSTHGIKPIFILDPNYPRRLKQCIDAPIVLYYRGEDLLNSRRTLAIVGSRMHTTYGIELIKELMQGLSEAGVITVSGLAMGIDSVAHDYSIKNNIPTVAVLGSGLNQVFPKRNTKLAQEILAHGGALLSEYSVFSKPVRENFPVRNRIVAGLSDATIVVESREKGGALITADLANDYNRDVFAYPGSVHQQYSAGCNALIRQQKAHLVTNSSDILNMLGWDKPRSRQQELSLPMNLSTDEQLILSILKQHESLYMDELVIHSCMPTSQLHGLLLGLELKGQIGRTSGTKYRLN
ncbi:MAG: DNA-protecting protein DprA [Bacteroidota bacterium]|jgi:DNA processing protein